ncbi:unnamed protein product [Blepharisma stoltei]|uniref:PCI domain-containing protein n=1 Tax=Blepharisma stoltei TaxID=1481888 RepID=A0AAU9JQ17_9CILI|nr:unnamed protein product [Blepharisma stoltei]
MEDLKRAKELLKTDPESGISLLRTLIHTELPEEENARVKEAAVLALGEVLAKQHRASDLAYLVEEIRPLFNAFPKAKTAKIVRSLIDYSSLIPDSLALQIKLCEDSIAWCNEEKRAFLRQRLETKLAQLYLDSNRYKEALDSLSVLLKEVKKLDDKLQLVEIQLIESKVYHKLENVPRAKAALTSSRSCANSIYCPPILQAEIDLMSGILNCEEKDYRTGFSYFYEAHEGFNSVEDPRALQALKYMLMSKIMCNKPEDAYALINTKGGIKYTGREIDAMKAVAHAHEIRSLHEFQAILQSYRDELEGDSVVNRHIQALYDTMLEQHLIRIIEPFSKVELSHIAELIGLPEDSVTDKLSQMILDKKFEGTLDQGIGCLIVYDDPPTSKLYDTSLKFLDTLNLVVDSLFEKATQAKA